MTRVERLSALALLAAGLAGCASLPDGRDGQQDGPPAHTPAYLASLPELVPVDEPISRYGNPETYEVFGRTYRTWDSAEGYVEEGIASWYGRKFHGRRTSSGEPYDMYALSAAHRYLPLPTFVRVTNLDNGRTTVLRVNDRGPFHRDRFIDLSFAAAVKLGFHERGTARVRVETVRPSAGSPAPKIAERREPTPEQRANAPANVLVAPSQSSEPLQSASLDPTLTQPQLPPQSDSTFVLQAGAFSVLTSADRLARELSETVSAPAYVVQTNDDGYYRVRLGPFAGIREARRIQALISAQMRQRVMLLEQPSGSG